jgi:hypothetical protein
VKRAIFAVESGRVTGDEGREKYRNGCREDLNKESVNFCQLRGITFQQ